MFEKPTNSPRPTEAWLTAHARRRCRQRGTNCELIAALYNWADTEVSMGGGITSISASADSEHEMRDAGLPSGLIDHIRSRLLLQAADGWVVTVIAGRRTAAHYRRPINRRAPRRRNWYR
jgi:hypothetical protein